MLIKITTDIYIEVADEDQAEEAAMTIDSGLENIMTPFPAGSVEMVKVTEATPVSDAEAEAAGFIE
jgi:hypothetical protein